MPQPARTAVHTGGLIGPRGGPERSAAWWLRVAVATLLAAAAVVGLALSTVSIDVLQGHAHGLTSTGDAGPTHEAVTALVRRLRIIALSLGLASAVLLTAGRRLDPSLQSVAEGWRSALARAPRGLRRWLVGTPNAEVGALVLVSTIGAGLRLAYLDVPLRYDEATTWFSYVSKPLYVGLSNYSAPNDHLLNTALAKLSVTLFGDGPTALRLPALLAAIAAVPAAYALGCRLYGRAAGLLGASLVASSSTLVEYSANARGYALVVLLTLLALVAAVRVVDDDGLPAWAAVALALALGLYAVPTMLYAACGVLLWISLSQLVAGRPARRVLRRTGTCALWTATLTTAFYAPVLVVSGPRAVTSNEFVTSLSVADFLGRLPGHAADTVQTWARDLPTPVAVALALLLVVSLLLTPRLSRFPVPPLAAFIAAAVAVLLVQRAVPFTRVWLFCVPVAAVTVAGLPGRPLDSARRGRIAAPALAVLVALAGAVVVLAADSPRTSRETGGLLDAPAVARYLAGTVTASDRILATGSDTILAYYLHRDGVDAGSLIFTTSPRHRTYVVVNVLGNQTLDGVLGDLGEPRDRYGPARLVRRWGTASVYLLERL